MACIFASIKNGYPIKVFNGIQLGYEFNFCLEVIYHVSRFIIFANKLMLQNKSNCINYNLKAEIFSDSNSHINTVKPTKA
jgi:hypothetical protein